MNILFKLKSFFDKQVPLSVSIAMDTLREAQEHFKEPVFDNEIKSKIEQAIDKNYDKFLELFDNKEHSPKEWVIAQISNIAGDLLESGHFMIYRGVLSREGEALWKYYCYAMEELKKMKAMGGDGKPISDEYINEQKECLKEAIKNVG